MAIYSGPLLVLSGGNANTSPSNALGGLPSTVAGGVVSSYSWAISPPIPGVTYRFSRTDLVGVGSLSWNSGTGVLTYTDKDGTANTTTLAGTGHYVVGGSVLKVDTTLLPPSGTHTSTVTVTARRVNIFDDVEWAERGAIATNYRALYIYNPTAVALGSVYVSVQQPTYGEVTLMNEFGQAVSATRLMNSGRYDGIASYASPSLNHLTDRTYSEQPLIYSTGTEQVCNGASGGTVTIANELTVPSVSNVTWATRIGIGSIQAGLYKSFWIRRVIPANTGSNQLNDVLNFVVGYA